MKPMVGWVCAGAVLLVAMGLSQGVEAASPRQEATPKLIQDGFGPGGHDLSGDGANYCVPTTGNISLGYLANRGFTQLLPADASDADYLNLERILVGLSDAGFTSGAYYDDLTTAMETYTMAKGIDSFSFTSQEAPDVAWFADYNDDDYTAVFLATRWMWPDDENEWYDVGGHAMYVAEAGVDANGNPAPNTLVMSNPEPSALFNVADVPEELFQYAQTIPLTQTLESGTLPQPSGDYIQYDYNQANSVLSDNVDAGLLGVIETGYAVSIDADDLPDGGWTPATWTLDEDHNTWDFDDATFAIEAAIEGSVGFTKGGSGVLQLKNNVDTQGAYTLQAGEVQMLSGDTTPLGEGNITTDTVTLHFAPTGSPDTITIASDTSSGMTYEGGTVISLEASPGNAFDLVIGNSTDQTNSLHRSGTGTLEIVLPDSNGVSQLGDPSYFRVLVNGSGGFPSTHGMVRPFIVARDTNGVASFLSYDATDGFEAVNYTGSSSVDINSTTTSTIYDVASDTQTVTAGQTAQVHAIRLDNAEVAGDAGVSLEVGTQSFGETSGVILTHASVVSVPTLNFGDAEAAVHTIGENNVISSQVQGTAGLIKFGPGDLTLTANNNYTGQTTINRGTLIAANTAVNNTQSATGAGQVNIEHGATLRVQSGARIVGDIYATGGNVELNGGTITNLTTDISSRVTGSGTVTGTSSIKGALDPGDNTLSFELGAGETISLDGDSMLVWTLGGLYDSNNGGVAGTDWTLLNIDAESSVRVSFDGFALENAFADGVLTPNSGDTFWDDDRQWLLIDSNIPLAEDGSVWDPSFSIATYIQGSFSTQFVVDEGNDVHQLWLTYTAIPEPGTWVLFTGVVITAIGWRRRAA